MLNGIGFLFAKGLGGGMGAVVAATIKINCFHFPLEEWATLKGKNLLPV